MGEFKKSNLHIGMRKIKSILAICIGFLVWQLIRVPFPDLEIHPIFVYLYGLLEIRETSEKTKTMGFCRLKATGIGLAFGLPALALFLFLRQYIEPQWLQSIFQLALIVCGVVLTLTLGKMAGCGALTGIAAVVFIIMMVSHTDDERYLYAVLRALQTVIGVGVAWLLNVKLLPYSGKQ